MKKISALFLALAMTFSMLVTPVSAFFVSFVTTTYYPMSNEVQSMTLHVKNADGGYDKLPVYDENGNQLYVQVGKDEWEKLDTPIPSEEVARQQAEAEKAEKAATAKKKAEMEKAYTIKITDDYATNTGMLEELEWLIQSIPAELRTKVTAQLTKMGRTLKVDSYINGTTSMAGYAGYYTSNGTAIYLMDGYAFPHEYGHLIFMTVLPQLYNSTTLKNEWNGLTGSEGPTHVTSYAETSYHEDLAETFHTIIMSPSTIRNLSVEYSDCLVVKKANLMRSVLNKAFSLGDSVLPSLVPSQPSTWAKAEVEEYQNILDGGEESVVPSENNAHSTGYQVPATRLQFVTSIYEDMLRNLSIEGYFGNMSYDEYEKKWRPEPERVNGKMTTQFTDVVFPDISYTGVHAIHSMYLNGVINGKSETIFDPQGQITRQEAATILYRLCKALGYKLPKGDVNAFADSDKVAPWAQEAVAAVSAAGIMNGVGNNNFDPTGVYTCEQCALCLLRLYKSMIS